MEQESDNQLNDLGDEKLIDISKEDDDLLSHSSLFDSLQDLRLSAALDNTNEHEGFKVSEFQPSQEVESTVKNVLQKEQRLSSSHDFVRARPSYWRESLAWDSAFFTSAGVLDNDELNFINGGFKTGEMQLPPDTPSMNIKVSIQNKSKTSASLGRNINNQISAKNKTERISKREEFHSLPLKAPRACSRMKNVLLGHSKTASVDYHAKVENKTSAVRSGNHLKLSKKSALGNSRSLSSGSLSFSEYSSVNSSSVNNATVASSSHDRKACASSTKVSSVFLKRTTEPRKSKLSDLISFSDSAGRYLVKGKGLGHPRFSTQSLSLSNNFSCISSPVSSKGSSSEPRSRAKQQSNYTENHLNTPVTLKRRSSEDELNPSPYSVKILHRKSTLRCQREDMNYSVQWSKESLTDSSHLPTESRKKLKPSYLRMPSPKLGFFDEEKSVMPTMGRSLQFHSEMLCTPPSKSGSSNRKTPSSETKCMKPGSRNTRLFPVQDIINPQHVASDAKLKRTTMKSMSDVGLRFRSGTFGEVKEEICSKRRKDGAGESDRKRAGQNSALRRDDERRRVKGSINRRSSRDAKGPRTGNIFRPELSSSIKKEQNGSKQHNANNLYSSVEDQVNDLSRYFEVIDLSRDMVTKNEEDEKDCTLSQVDKIISKLDDDHIVAHDSNPPPTSRTPLADKTSVVNTSGSLIQSTTKENLAEKPPEFPCPEGLPYKENNCIPI